MAKDIGHRRITAASRRWLPPFRPAGLVKGAGRHHLRPPTSFKKLPAGTVEPAEQAKDILLTTSSPARSWPPTPPS
jgi:hypothetical protein